MRNDITYEGFSSSFLQFRNI